MSHFISFGSAPTNPNVTFEALGFGSNGAGTTITANASANAKGTGVPIATTSAAWTGFILYAANASAASLRWLIDLSFDGGSSWTAVSNVYTSANTAAQQSLAQRIPLIVPASTSVYARAQCSTGAATIKVALEGIVGGTTNAPGFTTFSSLLADTTNTRPSTIDVPLDDDGSSGWTQLISSTAATYGAIMGVVDGNGTVFGAAQAATVLLGTGAAASEVEIGRWMVGLNTTTVGVTRGWGAPVETSIPSGTRISAQIRAATPGAGPDNGRIGLYGLS
jgi:hypothetical protein